ncbi:MAG: 30S ribosomal protein S16 [Chloroflexi bacterium]|nr:30S ribosomal protein S16 [Chloroflexota bacterium]
MVKLKLRRVGKKKQPYYRLVAADSRCAPSGRFIENLGHYDPHTDPPTLTFKEDRIREWLSNGAMPTESVERLLVLAGIKERPEYPAQPAAKEPEAPKAETE